MKKKFYVYYDVLAEIELDSKVWKPEPNDVENWEDGINWDKVYDAAQDHAKKIHPDAELSSTTEIGEVTP